MRPTFTRTDIEARIEAAGFVVPKKPYLFAARPAPGIDKINVYDDAIALVQPLSLTTFNANTDPSRYEPRMATLAPGSYLYVVGTHNISKEKSKQYEALVQADKVTVNRWPDADPKTPEHESGYFGINIHRGGYTTTGSAGCQTIHPDQWTEFMLVVKKAMFAANTYVIPYILIEG